MNKLKASTIIEMIVTMLIAGVTISIAYSSYKIISGQFGSYKAKSYRNYEIVLIDKFMLKDIESSTRVYRTSNGFKCQYTDKFVEYLFEDNYILRNSSMVDTFKLTVSDPKFYFLSNEEFVPGGLIDRIEFEGNTDEVILPFHFKKEYGADILIENDKREE